MLKLLSQNIPRGKRVLLRADFNVPIKNGRVVDDFRIRAELPTIRSLLKAGNRVFIVSHHSDVRQTLRPVAPVLQRLLGVPVTFIVDPRHLRAGSRAQLVLIENLRSWPGEMKKGAVLTKFLSSIVDVFVEDAFGVAHHASPTLIGLPKLLPSCLGPLFAREIAEFDRLLKRTKRPLVAVFGGAKIETKLALLNRFRRVAARVLVGGALANEILAVIGVPIRLGRKLSPSLRRSVRTIAHAHSVMLPKDLVCPVGKKGKHIFLVTSFLKNNLAYDIGPATLREFSAVLKRAKTIVWNGPMGFVEDGRFRGGTEGIARVVRHSKARSVIGGGDTLAFLGRRGVRGFSYVSTGGGAMLAYLAGEKLPALEALRRANK